jgi:hypothetical protein
MSDVIEKDILFLSTRLRNRRLSPVVLSVIASEMYFRRPLHRLLEYLAWVILWGVGSKRIETLSVGIAQVQLRTWKQLGYINSCVPSIFNLMVVLNIENNYAACGGVLGRSISLSEMNHRELSRIYLGRARIFHVKVIELAFNIAKSFSQRAKGMRG